VDAARRSAERDVPVVEDTAVRCGQDVAVGAAGRCVARYLEGGARRAGVTGQLWVVMELWPRPGFVDARPDSVRRVDLPVTDVPRRRTADADVAGAGDADVAVRVVGHQRCALEAVVGTERGHFGSGPAVEDVDTVGGGDDDVLVATTGEVGGHGRADDLTRRRADQMAAPLVPFNT